MDERTLENFAQRLRTRLYELDRGLAMVLTANQEAAGGRHDPMDDVDATACRTAWEDRVRMHHRNRLLAFEITQALDRIRNGDFGICISCGDSIGLKRLQAHPMTTVCIECKKRVEAMQRLKAA
jgi:DnaK suppressor protein